tara:strand:- start:207 stop:470 length:264 start_codon:yes stop_codon:yes gene_type:complete
MKNKKLSAGQKSKERIKGKLSLLKRAMKVHTLTMTGFAHKESNWLEDVDRSASCLRSVLNNEELTDKNGLDALERKYEHLENVKDMK